MKGIETYHKYKLDRNDLLCEASTIIIYCELNLQAAYVYLSHGESGGLLSPTMYLRYPQLWPCVSQDYVLAFPRTIPRNI
eukprot:1393352-Amorphochlora_amoeboformis.AAC.1